MKVTAGETKGGNGLVNGVNLNIQFQSAMEAVKFVAILGGLNPTKEMELISHTKYGRNIDIPRHLDVTEEVFDKLDDVVVAGLKSAGRVLI